MQGVGTTYSGSGTNDNDLVFDLTNMELFDTFMLSSTAGAMDVFVSLDGTNFTTAALSLLDLGANTEITLALDTVANRMYAFRGKYKAIQVRQKGATAVENAALRVGFL